jgi:hypothetical protein
MRRLFYFSLALVLLTTFSCKRNSAERQYERYLNDSNRVEFVAPKVDSVEIEEEGLASDKEMDYGEDVFEIPDIPKERQINMNSSDDELEKIMGGEDVEEEKKKK